MNRAIREGAEWSEPDLGVRLVPVAQGERRVMRVFVQGVETEHALAELRAVDGGWPPGFAVVWTLGTHLTLGSGAPASAARLVLGLVRAFKAGKALGGRGPGA